jgi:hypothetical protein
MKGAGLAAAPFIMVMHGKTREFAAIFRTKR